MKKGEVWSVEFPLEEDPDRILNRPVIVLDEIYWVYYLLRLQNTRRKLKIHMIYLLFIGMKLG